METTKLIELLSYTLPAVITGVVAYYFFDIHTKNEEGRSRFIHQNESKKDGLPIRLQAFERMTLFLERIHLAKLLIRITPISDDKNDYENYVIAQIEQEFEHNLTQQIYMSTECWNIIVAAKNATIQRIRSANLSERVVNANKLREVILNDLMDTPSPSSAALAYMKNEVNSLF